MAGLRGGWERVLVELEEAVWYTRQVEALSITESIEYITESVEALSGVTECLLHRFLQYLVVYTTRVRGTHTTPRFLHFVVPMTVQHPHANHVYWLP